MTEEIKIKIGLIEKKLATMEVGSVGHGVYTEIKKELLKRIEDESKEVKLHIAEEQTCDGCQ